MIERTEEEMALADGPLQPWVGIYSDTSAIIIHKQSSTSINPFIDKISLSHCLSVSLSPPFSVSILSYLALFPCKACLPQGQNGNLPNQEPAAIPQIIKPGEREVPIVFCVDRSDIMGLVAAIRHV